MSDPSIAMCWDGETPAAELRVDGLVLTGEPRDVQRAFDALNKLKDRALVAERRVASARHHAERVIEETFR
jgi:hypothetical protein